MAVEVRDLDESSVRAWEFYVAGHQDGTLFHTLLWRDAVREAFGHRSCYLTAWRGGACVGVFPLMQVSSCLAGTILVSVPYAVYGGTLADDPEAHAALLDRARQLAARLKAQWIDIRSVASQWPELPVVRRYVTFRKRLPRDVDRVMSSLPRKARAAARQAREVYHLEASFDDSHLGTVWSLYSRSMRRLASPNYPLKFFRYLVEHTPAVGSGTGTNGEDSRPGHMVQLIRHGCRPIAGLVSFVYRGTLMPYFSGCDDGFERTHPNNFLYLTAMERGVEAGCQAFDFGRSRVDNAGACNFKRFQGFEPTPLHYQYYVPDGGRAPNLHPGNARLSLARRVWPRLPLAVTRPLGSWLARSIPG
ncbi:MAG TPA: FemAB family PEP-CTERM system-associated protein [Phycisphaerae bacterium]|nr:FemAB family PEP-CTERM system-associated protein [Phycisphaerae bacterium]HRY68977.1 FemAB family PEP-CTERM system-associated protein [Phycisphaerae bacterium]HSA26049.1 FemAB family PEP-CTERM system-associated protein [Phycisphaerae bacterium]